jgi:hypothetical protein
MQRITIHKCRFVVKVQSCGTNHFNFNRLAHHFLIQFQTQELCLMPGSFEAGEADADSSAPSIETMGARYGIKVVRPGVGIQKELTEPYLLPSVHFKNGNMETVVPSIQHTPLGAMMPGPNAIAPAIPAGAVGMQQIPEDANDFVMGIRDAYNGENCPIPFRV